ncbi:Flp family type IVb pilin [Vibrio splendidus]|uniref:Fimbrial protein n=1 Tax=Vibrio lentus TaxID=136468 RepID=A0A855ISX9_9VIBR|nr:Flp family type IVb pilin [Vibrio lentus]PHN83512.1 Flp family type IVb pilin [Vibrio splendidus]MCB5362005.1 Flp family type IVb pilin [Vibrio lentus]MCB5452340.1 Flp family type IVb pilin [Vibrio lentus]MCB5464373.1 Flp family type IVb pilin [Vibrio lentus]MCB5464509.1 Flp family type IVb pilin [Vibrio lentus]
MLSNWYVKTKLTFEKLVRDQRGVTAVEYAIIGVAISAIVLVMFNGELQEALIGAVSNISDNINSANTNARN